ncbi:hypothetical protein ACRALDRAFT_1073846 [Sodiomyces alcalophilus JCM 7366]|uniref:uncharacterized protein n=1 Tax=Sodiomyces alcalophilus JCM 7366 TaxID=591952 RepID=UPI0039B405A8
MAYIAPIHRPSSIREAISIRLWPDEDVLVTAKVNRIEISRVSIDGITLVSSATVCGTITFLQRLQPKTSDTDLLFVGTDRFHYFTARWDPEARRLQTEQVIDDLAEPHMRESESQNKCLVDPTGHFMAMHLWEGVLNVMRLGSRKNTNLRIERDWAQVRLSELFIKSSIFVPTETKHPTIAFLYQTAIDKEDASLSVYRLMSDDRNTDVSRFDPRKDRELDLEIPDPFARILIPVTVVEPTVKRYHHRDTTGAKAQLGGLIVVGETLLIYIDILTKSRVKHTLEEPKIFVAWAELDVSHYFLADDYGGMHLLTLDVDDAVVTGMSIKHIGKTSRASCLVYMGNDLLFLGSHHGDSQLFLFDIASETIRLVQTVPNVAPILDFAIMDLGNAGDNQVGNAFSSGQARIVAGCGVHHNGSLRSIRSSVGLEDIGVLDDLPGVRGLFSLKSYGSAQVDTLVVSFVTETRVFRFDPEGGIEEVPDFQGLVMDQPTLVAASLPSGHMLQVTPSTVSLFDSESGISVSTWTVPEGSSIVTASANDKWVLLSVDGTRLVSLDIPGNFAATEQVVGGDMGGESGQISCVHVTYDLPDVGVVGFWSKGSVSIINLRTLEALQGHTIKQNDDSVSVPRDIALVQLHPPDVSGPTLFVAMEDGQVVSLNVSKDDYSLSGRKSVTLGSREAGLHVLPRPGAPGQRNVFATTEHSSLIYSAEGRIIYSAATAENVRYIAPFDSESFPDSVFVATDEHIRIAQVDTERRTHVNPLHIGETVRRVAYSPGLKAFGIGTIKKELVGDEEMVSSVFQLVDEIVLGHVGKPFALNTTPSVEMVEAVIRAELPDSTGHKAERFVVGTSYLADPSVQDAGDVLGRILVLGVDSDRNPYQIVSHELKGACRCLATMDDLIVAGLSKTVVVYDYIEETTTKGRLQKLATFRPSTFPVDLYVSGTMIGVADLMQSMTVIEYVRPQNGQKAKLVERARHFEYAWATAVCHLGGNSWLEADAQGNLLVLEQNTDAPTEHDRKKMRMTSEMHLGEQVNKIRPLHITPGENDLIVPKAFLATVEGSLYVVADINPAYLNVLLPLQEKLAKVVRFLGQGASHDPAGYFNSWRGFRNAKRAADAPFRFVDGEFIERFLDLNEVRQEEVVEGLGPSVEAVRNMVEELRRMH